jgi:hypothetical protein
MGPKLFDQHCLGFAQVPLSVVPWNFPVLFD